MMKFLVFLFSLLVSSGVCASYDADAEKFVMASVPNEYIVVLNSEINTQDHKPFNAQVLRRFPRLNGILVQTDDPDSLVTSGVKYVEANSRVTILTQQSNATWGIDRIDSRSGLDQTYNYASTGQGVHVYVVDTGLKVSHKEFSGRIGNGFSAIGNSTEDCNGHGTHVAGTVLGTTYGVAKKATIHPIRVLDCEGGGTMSGIIEGIEWLITNAKSPAVANMSLGGNKSQALNDVVAKATKAGILFVVAAGNSADSACKYSPASAPQAITVAASGKTDKSTSFTSYGTCVDIYGPGEGILSAGISSDTSTDTMSGTSMASPHVAGAVALLMGQDPSASPEAITSALIGDATRGIITAVPSGTPNLMLFTDPSQQPNPEPTPEPEPTPDPDPEIGIPSECRQAGACLVESGNLTAQKYYIQAPKDLMMVTSARDLKIHAQGSADLDLYLYFYNGSKWVLVASENGTGDTESMTYRANAKGYYTWIVMLKTSGTNGSYKLWIVK